MDWTTELGDLGDEKILTLACEADLATFVQYAWPTVVPAATFQDNWHISAICEYLMALYRLKFKNLLINVPPRFGKSVVSSVMFPAWLWLQDPNLRMLYSSYAQTLAIRDSLATRQLIQSRWYQEKWADRFTIASDQNEKMRFENTSKGYRLATSVGGANTGEGGDIIVCVPGSTIIQTDDGPVPIESLVDRRLRLKVLGASGWQAVSKFYASPGRPVLDFTLENGSKFRCTENHPVFVEGNGYVSASSVCAGAIVRRLRQAFSFPQKSVSHDTENVLPFVWLDSEEEAAHSLPMRTAGQDSAQHVLLSAMRVGGTGGQNSGRQERALYRRSVDTRLRAGIHSQHPQSDSSERRRAVRDLQIPEAPASAPYRQTEDRPPSDKSRNALHELSQDRTYENRAERGLDETIRVVAVRRGAAPATVFNLETEDHTYYADGVLTHNCDDPHNVAEAESDLKREEAVRWWNEVMSTRGNDPRTARRIVIAQRAHFADLSQDILSKGEYVHLNLAMEFEAGETQISIPSGIAWAPLTQDPRKDDGSLLWPERFDAAKVASMKIDMGSYAYASQFQQRPTPREGGMFKFDRIQFDPLSVELRMEKGWDDSCWSWDCSFKDLEDSAYVVGQAWIRQGANFFLLFQMRGRMAFSATKKAIRACSAKWPGRITRILVEDKANGTAVIDDLKNTVPGLYPVEPKGGKESRAATVEPVWEAGNIYLPTNAPWAAEFIQECTEFPRGAYDDQVDAMSQALVWLLERYNVKSAAEVTSVTRSMIGNAGREPKWRDPRGE